MKKTIRQKKFEKASKEVNSAINKLIKMFEKYKTKAIYKQLKDLSGL